MRLAPVAIKYGQWIEDQPDALALRVGAVCGQLAGAYWGESGIPASWQKTLARRDLIEETMRRLIDS
jgi:hypothetical protein